MITQKFLMTGIHGKTDKFRIEILASAWSSAATARELLLCTLVCSARGINSMLLSEKKEQKIRWSQVGHAAG